MVVLGAPRCDCHARPTSKRQDDNHQQPEEPLGEVDDRGTHRVGLPCGYHAVKAPRLHYKRFHPTGATCQPNSYFVTTLMFAVRRRA